MEVPPNPIKDAFEFEVDAPEKNDNLIVYVGPAADNFFSFYDLNFVAGADFPDYIAGQKFESYILNETAVGFLGWKDPAEAIGKRFKIDFFRDDIFYGGKIVGVVEDFHQASLHHKIEPTVYFQQPLFYLSFLIKVPKQNTQQALDQMEACWNNFFPEYPFVYTFQDHLYEEKYRKEIMQSKLTRLFSILAFVIAIIGLMGITIILTEQRTREIGIRIMLGSGISRILLKLSTEIIVVLTLATGVAMPVSLFLVDKLLQNFAYSIMLANHWWIPLVISLTFIAVIATIVVSTIYQTAQKKPIESLKWE